MFLLISCLSSCFKCNDIPDYYRLFRCGWCFDTFCVYGPYRLKNRLITLGLREIFLFFFFNGVIENTCLCERMWAQVQNVFLKCLHWRQIQMGLNWNQMAGREEHSLGTTASRMHARTRTRSVCVCVRACMGLMRQKHKGELIWWVADKYYIHLIIAKCTDPLMTSWSSPNFGILFLWMVHSLWKLAQSPSALFLSLIYNFFYPITIYPVPMVYVFITRFSQVLSLILSPRNGSRYSSNHAVVTKMFQICREQCFVFWSMALSNLYPAMCPHGKAKSRCWAVARKLTIELWHSVISRRWRQRGESIAWISCCLQFFKM